MEVGRICPYCRRCFDLIVDIAVVKESKIEQGSPVVWKEKGDKELLVEEPLAPTVPSETATDGKP